MSIMKFFGFENDEDDYDDDSDYTEDTRSSRKTSGKREGSTRSSSQGRPNAAGRLILYRGVADDNDKRRLRDAFNDGAMILVDLHDLDQREYEESGKEFITFLGGVAFARNGDRRFIEPAQYIFTPRADMFEAWPEGGGTE